jgi:hypothetical protein
VRVRNEAERLEAALSSLKGLTIPHEIIVICHLCTDLSAEIAAAARSAGQPVTVFTYSVDISRAGFETLATPKHHPHSLITFYDWCLQKATFTWTFKWDADFIATPELITFLNTTFEESILNDSQAINIYIGVAFTEDIVDEEPYLSNCIQCYGKYLLWEVPKFTEANVKLRIAQRIRSIPPTILKDYWRRPAWFLTSTEECAVECKRAYDQIVEAVGPEPLGISRASNAEWPATARILSERRKHLEALGVTFQ